MEGGEEAVSVVALHSTEWRGEERWERGGSVVIPYSQPQVESIMEHNESRIGYNSGATILQQNFCHSRSEAETTQEHPAVHSANTHGRLNYTH